jgi:hypothetical protein
MDQEDKYSFIPTNSIKNCILIGFEAGIHLTNEEGVIIIGDYIRDMKHIDDVVRIQDRVIIGKMLFGKPCNLYDLLKEAFQTGEQTK